MHCFFAVTLTPKISTNVTLYCKYDRSPESIPAVWTHNGVMIVNGTTVVDKWKSSIVAHSDGELVINAITVIHSGKYKCKSVTATRTHLAEFRLHVIYSTFDYLYLYKTSNDGNIFITFPFSVFHTDYNSVFAVLVGLLLAVIATSSTSTVLIMF